MTIISHEEGFCACLESKGTSIYMKTWTPCQDELEMYPHVQLSSSERWDPQEIKFPGYSYSERTKIESRNISSIGSNSADEWKVVNIKDGIYNGLTDYEIIGFNDDIISKQGISERNVSIANINVGPVEESEMKEPLTFISDNRHSSVTPADLSDKWCISIHQALMTLNATTRKFKRSALMPLSRRYRVDRLFGIRHLDYEISSDTIDGKVKSLHGNRCAQIFGSKEFFCDVYPMEKKSEAGIMLDKFLETYGVPKLLVYDG